MSNPQTITLTVELPSGNMSLAQARAVINKIMPEETVAETPTFKAGDTVQLRSGGPRMTVTIVGECKVRCKWWVAERFDDDFFTFASLVAR